MCRKLGLRIGTRGVVSSYRVAHGQTRKFAERLDALVIQLHSELALDVEKVLATECKKHMCILGNDLLSFTGDAFVHWTGARAVSDSSARV